MARIDLIDQVLYNADDPYHFEYDNLPLKNILRRQNLINLALDNLISQIADSIGTQGTLSNRLNQSINPDGSLKSDSIDEVLHDIGSHTDSDEYVRMKKEESDKLALIEDLANNITFEFQTDDEGDETVFFDNGNLYFAPSSTLSWTVTSPNIVQANLNFPVESAHQHYYDQDPIAENISDPDYINYKVNSSSSSFVEGSLKVFVNGVRLTESDSIYVPGYLVNDPWVLLTYTSDSENGTFSLSTSITEDDVIRIDYDISYV